jgi:protoporphyrinogen oxidase
MNVLVLGGGLAGLSCGWQLLQRGLSFSVHERSKRPGGTAGSTVEDGYVFDRTGHWLHLRDDAVRAWVNDLFDGQLIEIERRSRIRSHGVFTHYPFQANTYGLPSAVIQECVTGFVEALRKRDRGEDRPPANLHEALLQWFGEGIARHFMLPYNEKLWGVPATEITAAWCSRFVPRPSLDAVVAGAVGAPAEGLGYNPRFVYPNTGGIGGLAERLAAQLGESLNVDHAAVEVRWQERQVRFQDGEVRPYDRLVSSIPLPDLIRLMAPSPPSAVVAAAARLRATSVAYVDLGVRGPVNEGHHWVYFPAPEVPFYRVGSYSNVAPHLAPEGHGSLYVETSVPPGGSLPDWSTLMPRIRAGLVEHGLIESEQAIVLERPRLIKCAYVLFDHAYAESRGEALSWLDEVAIEPIGRYGRWTYSSMEDALLDGLEAGAA